MTLSSPVSLSLVENASSLQKRAANHTSNVWVMASAGTGKTTVLVERYIRLLLSYKTVRPEKILCLTYTRAAATQMKERVLQRLSQWVCMEEEDLRAELAPMVDTAVTDELIRKARSLFGSLLDQIDHLRILTIHAFCQSLLARFQIEAGMESGTEIMTDSAKQALMQDVLNDILETEHADYIEELAQMTADNGWAEILDLIVSNKSDFQTLERDDRDIPTMISDLLNVTGLSYQKTKIDILSDSALPWPLLSQWPKKDTVIATLESCPERERGHLYEAYRALFVTKTTNAPLARGPFKGDEVLNAAAKAEALRLLAAEAHLRAIVTARTSANLYKLAQATLTRYEARKQQLGYVDYDDLIEKTRHLLADADSADWVRYKLDGGIDHVLLDEAQDTSPAQWRIIREIVQEYFAGISQYDPEFRTLFVVGDTKQSIFSFQGADPDVAAEYHTYFEEQALQGKRPWDNVPMATSFRTAQDILDIVDACGGSGVWQEASHQAGRPHPGRVELHPLQEADAENEKSAPWSMPNKQDMTPRLRVINQVADQIKSMLDARIALPSKNGAPIEPHDILILLRNRNHFPLPLIQALRVRGIPVAGLDRFALTDDLAAQDILTLLKWSLFPDDKLSLASILVSPLVGWTHTALEEFLKTEAARYDFYQAVCAQAPAIASWLSIIQNKARIMPVASTIRFILEAPCPADTVSGRRAMMARLGPSCLEPLNQLLSYSYECEIEHRSALSFLHHIERHAPVIKRELEGDQGTSGVRIMTTHGAKGLEAPIVFMPDTVRGSQEGRKISPVKWADGPGGISLPLWAPTKSDQCDELRHLLQDGKDAEEREYNRLLYVAMTRAKDALIVMGAADSKPKDTSWYFTIRKGMEQCAAQKNDNGVLIYGTWTPEPAQSIPETPSVLMQYPSFDRTITMEEVEESAVIDTVWKNEQAVSIGRQWHTILERALPHHADILSAKIKDWTTDLPDLDPNIVTARIHALRNHEQYGFLFQPDGAVEVPFITTGHHQPVRGRIDRLVRTEDAFWILDYKTRLNLDDVQQRDAYMMQMKSYAAAISPIAGGLPVRIALVDISAAAVHPLDFMP